MIISLYLQIYYRGRQPVWEIEKFADCSITITDALGDFFSDFSFF